MARSANWPPTSPPPTMPTSSATTSSRSAPSPTRSPPGRSSSTSRKKNGYEGASVTCAHCGQAAEFHSHRPHSALSLVGPFRYRRAYYLCRTCGKGLFPFDRQAALTSRDLTPALERIATLAGAVADRFEKG